MFRIHSPRDFWSGAMFFAIGGAFAIGARGYSFGSSAEPGPGYFPFGLGLLLTLLGVAGVWRGLQAGHGDASPIGWPAWRPLFVICASIAAFGYAVPHFGLVIALPIVVIVSALAGDEFRWREAVLNAALLTVGCWAVFIWGLQLPMPVWPAGLRFGG